MTSHRLRKQILYGLFYLCFWIILIGGTYLLFIKPAPSCHDNIQNQGEEGTDCGQVCSNVCIPTDIKPLERSGSVTVFPIDESHATVLVRVQNPNTTFAAKNFSYTLQIYDAQGALLKKIEKSSFIYGAEFKYLLEPNIDVRRSADISRIVLTLDANPEWVPVNDFVKPNLSTQVRGTTSDNNHVRAEGLLINRDSISFSEPSVVALFYATTGELIGASQTTLGPIAPNDTEPFAVEHPALSNINTSRTELFISALRP